MFPLKQNAEWFSLTGTSIKAQSVCSTFDILFYEFQTNPRCARLHLHKPPSSSSRTQLTVFVKKWIWPSVGAINLITSHSTCIDRLKNKRSRRLPSSAELCLFSLDLFVHWFATGSQWQPELNSKGWLIRQGFGTCEYVMMHERLTASHPPSHPRPPSRWILRSYPEVLIPFSAQEETRCPN